MHSNTVLQEWSLAGASLAAALSARALSIHVRHGRALSGFRWRSHWIVTAAEGLEGSEQVLVCDTQEARWAKVIACDLRTDVAIVRWDSPSASASADTTTVATPAAPGTAATPATSGAPTALNAGDGVMFVGRSRHAPLVGFGHVRLAGPAWSSRQGGTIDRRLEFQANLDSRFEGSLIADFAGQVQGMLVFGPRGSLLGIPAATIERVVAAVDQHGYLPRAYLGVRLQSLWLDRATRARWGYRARSMPVVAGVEPGSPAETAGIVAGDLLESIDGVAIGDVETLAARLGRSRVGEVKTLGLRRGGIPQTVEVTLSERRAPHGC
jgi:serine protease Do